MLILAHVLIAITSLVLATRAFFAPSKAAVRATNGFVALTLASGFYLTWTKPAHILQTCLVGLVYIGVVLLMITSTYQKLAKNSK